MFFLIGPPTCFTEWCGSIVARLAGQASGAITTIHADTLEDLSLGVIKSGATQAIVAARHPGGQVERALSKAGQPFVVVLDDTLTGLFALLGRGMAIAAAARLVAGSCAALPTFAALPGALVLRADRDGVDPERTAAALARHLEFGLGAADIAKIMRAVGPPPPLETVAEAAARWEALDPGSRALAEGALAPYLDNRPGRRPGSLPVSVVWGRELFFAGAPPGAPLPAEIDITGRARCLLRGPGILIPAGGWLVTIALDLTPDAAEHNFVLEAATGAITARTQIRPAAPGPLEASLTLDLPDLPDRPLELTLATQRPAFAGLVALRHVTLSPHPAADPSATSP